MYTKRGIIFFNCNMIVLILFFIRNEHEDEQLCGSKTARSPVLIADVLCQPLTGQPFIRGFRRDKKTRFA